jgi:hypothetical protein
MGLLAWIGLLAIVVVALLGIRWIIWITLWR